MKFSQFRTPALAVLAFAVAAALGGCSLFPFSSSKKGTDYRSATSDRLPPLEIPPDLTAPSGDERFVIPDSKSANTFSTYNRDRATPASTNSGVLPKVEKASVMRAGDQRWLVVNATPDKLWPILKDFWTENGFVLRRDTPDLGIMETDWAENRAAIPMDPIRNVIGKVLDGMYSTPERDKFRTRVEAGSQPGTTEVYISHRGLQEIYTNEYKDQTIWQPRKPDPELEAEMLNRLMLKLGFDEKKVQQQVAEAAVPAGAARAEYDRNTDKPLRINEPFDRAWRRVGLALDRVGFTVEDRDRSKGLFFVRYIDPEVDNRAPGEKSWFDKLKFWKRDVPDDNKPQYRIRVADAGGLSVVEVQNAKGDAEKSATGRRILGLLYDQLK